MRPSFADRRRFLATLAGGASASLLPTFAPRSAPVAAKSEFLLVEGLTYLNTGTIGPTRLTTIDATARAWATLEANPVAHYGQLAGAAMREDTRTVAAKFLGCDLDELALTGSTTAGMNAIAQGLRLGAGDRVLDAADMPKVEAHNLRLRDRLADHLRPISGLTLVSPPAGELASPLLTALLAARFDRQAVTRALLERHQVAIRATHPEFGFNGIRFSMHEFNTDTDVDRAADAVRQELAA